jgi:type I restriction enzyme M protein
MTDVVSRLWGFAHKLRHDGVDYGDYLEQITCLLFLKMADEQGIDLPDETDWPHLRRQSGVALVEHYEDALRTLGKQRGILGDIFSGSQNRISTPATLSQLIKSVDATDWTSLGIDVKAAAFEGLLEKAAAEGKKGAGQYFTPRPLIQSMVRLVQPDPRVAKSYAIGDPACGTGGFLVAAYEWLKEQTGGAFERSLAKRIRTKTYYGQELVPRPRRLALMNLYLHQVEPHITLGDSIYETPTRQRYDVIITNPPFGTKGANQVPAREDFVVETSNKQLNFLQHILMLLKTTGRAAVVVPDNVLFADRAGEVFKILMEDCNVHTVLRCPRGTFAPYTAGAKTNVLFFTKGQPTAKLWLYDARANVPTITKKARPLTPAHFEEFELCYGTDPNGGSARSESDSTDGRWRSFTLEEIIERDYKIDSFKWLRDDVQDDPDEVSDPAELVSESISELEAAVAALNELQGVLDETEIPG